jgi:DNA replicative helicase MCM subunit Mcm2 (Cdc46/Mcm family)
MNKVIDLIKEMIPISKEELDLLDFFKQFTNQKEFKIIEKYMKLDYIKISLFQPNISFIKIGSFAKIDIIDEKAINDSDLHIINDINYRVNGKIMNSIFLKFAKNYDLSNLVAPNIKGMEYIKKAVVIQLFASEPIHILLLGDPGTGKTDILRSVENIHPKSVFGLGSGTSGVGLSISMQGSQIIEGLLPRSNGGICCIDELNLMKQEDMAALYSAMEKGFITYDKGGHHIKRDAKIRVLATGNPIGDKFKGDKKEELRKQIPFDSALLTRFHLVFMVRKPDINTFIDITKKILSNKKVKDLAESDVKFLHSYIEYASSLDVIIPKKEQELISEIIGELKKREDDFLVEISPRTVIGFARLSKAHAKMYCRTKVTKEDIQTIKELFFSSLEY